MAAQKNFKEWRLRPGPHGCLRLPRRGPMKIALVMSPRQRQTRGRPKVPEAPAPTIATSVLVVIERV